MHTTDATAGPCRQEPGDAVITPHHRLVEESPNRGKVLSLIYKSSASGGGPTLGW
jgi:hypothetical protein